jgi:hypothetical protein
MPTRGPLRGFSYPSLSHDTRSFRLLELVNDYNSSLRKARTQLIICKLRTFSSSLSSRTPDYSALSYTWGCPFPEDEDSSDVKDWESPTRQIVCNDQQFYVARNLYDALQEFVRRGWFGFYWIDSLCINQGDVLERNAQVAIMGDIFQNAYEVICWLGRADRYLDDAVELHRRLVMVEEKFGGIEEVVMSPEEIDRACQTSKIGIKGHKPTASLCKPCENFWQRRWFNRLWVAQEVGLAKRLTVLCGDYEFDWQEMQLVAVHAYKAYFDIAWNSCFASREYPAIRLLHFTNIRHLQEEGIDKIMLPYKVKLGGGNEVRNTHLLEVLQLTATLQATDPRDKIFGVLGLVFRAPIDKKRPFRPININYDLSTCEIYTRFATALIIDLPSLYLIVWEVPYGDLRDFKLPSWVPDFSRKGVCDFRLMEPKYRAGIVSGQRSLREVNNKTLKVCGHLLGTITSTTAESSCMGQLQFLLSTKKTARWQPNIIESFCRAIFYGFDDGMHMTTQHKDKLKAWLLVGLSNLVAQGDQKLLQTFKSCLEALRSRVSKGTLPSQDTVYTWSMPNLHAHADQVQLLYARRLAGEFELNAQGKFLAFTDSGLLARITYKAQVNDQIWIIRDVPAPVILRPVLGSPRFTLVGAAYVDGVMFGEAVNHPDCPRPVKVEIV